MTDRRILNVVQDLIGPAYGAQSMFYFKPPTARGQALHQDNLFLRAHPETCLAVWIAIDDCDGENGGLDRAARFAPDPNPVSRRGRRPGRVLHGQGRFTCPTAWSACRPR